MAEVWVTDTLRPLRIAFLVPAADWIGVARAMQYSTALWGGMYNPIIELHSPVSKDDRDLIRLFDPDWFVFVGRSQPDGIEDLVYTHGTPEESLFDMVTTHAGVGCDMRVLMRYMCESGQGFFRLHDPLYGGFSEVPRLIKPGPAAPYKIALQGDYPDVCRPSFEKAYSKAFYPPGLEDTDPVFATTDDGAITYIRATSALLRDRERAGGGGFLLVVDPSATEDALCYWNARAAGAMVTMLPIAFDQPTLDDMDGLRRPLPIPQTEITIAYAPSISSRANHPAVEEALKRLSSGRPYGVADQPILQYGVHSFAVDTSTNEARLVASHVVRFEPNSPPFARTLRLMAPESSGPHWANEVIFDYRGSDRYRVAEVLPPSFDVVTEMQSRHPAHRGDVRFSLGGLTALVRAYDPTAEWHLPIGASVVATWLERHGIPLVPREGQPANVKARIVEKLVEMAGSLPDSADLLSTEGVRGLFRQLEGSKHAEPDDQGQAEPEALSTAISEGKDLPLDAIERLLFIDPCIDNGTAWIQSGNLAVRKKERSRCCWLRVCASEE